MKYVAKSKSTGAYFGPYDDEARAKRRAELANRLKKAGATDYEVVKSLDEEQDEMDMCHRDLTRVHKLLDRLDHHAAKRAAKLVNDARRELFEAVRE